MDPKRLAMFRALERESRRAPLPRNPAKNIVVNQRAGKPKMISKEVVMTNVDQLGPHISEVAEAITEPIVIPEERIFYDVSQLEEADRRQRTERQGLARPVHKLRKDYEFGMDKRRMSTATRGRSRRPISTGVDVSSLAPMYGQLVKHKKRIEREAALEKIRLEAEKVEQIAKIEAEEAQRRMEQHEERKEELMDKKMEILAKEHDEMMSHLAEKKESIVEDEYKEGVKFVEAAAEMEEKTAEEELAKKYKWYSPAVAKIPAHEIGKLVGEKKADMDALVKSIAKDVARSKRQSSNRRR